MRIATLAILVLSSPVLGQPAGGSSPSALVFAYNSPVFSTGFVNVYLSGEGEYWRTSPLQVVRREFGTDKKTLRIYLTSELESSEEKKLEDQVNQRINIAAKGITLSKASALRVLTPSNIAAELRGPNGKVLQTIWFAEPNLTAGGTSLPITLTGKAFAFPGGFDIGKLAISEANIKDYSVVIKSYYYLRGADTQYAGVQIVVSAGIVAIENNVGGKPVPGDFISRDAASSVSSAKFVSDKVLSINSNPDDLKLMLSTLAASLTKDTTITNDSLASMAKEWTVWTPALGKLEIKPKMQTFEEYEKSFERSAVSSYLAKASSLVNEAKSSSSFDSWYNTKRSKREIEGSTNTDTSAEADILGFMSGGGDASFSFDFKYKLDDSALDSGSKKRYQSAYSSLKSETMIESKADTRAKEFWKGKNRIIDSVAKRFDLAVMREASSVSKEFAEIVRVSLKSVSMYELPSQPVSLGDVSTIAERTAKEMNYWESLALCSVSESSAPNSIGSGITFGRVTFGTTSKGNFSGVTPVFRGVTKGGAVPSGFAPLEVEGKRLYIRRHGDEGVGHDLTAAWFPASDPHPDYFTLVCVNRK